jgi:hypothetical protein
MTGAEHFDPLAMLRDAWRASWRPRDKRAPWQWAETHVKSIPYSPIPGRFRSEHSPWIRVPMEAAVDPGTPCVAIMASIQSSKSSLAELTAAYIIPNLPGPMLWLDQTDDDASDQSESRLQKLFDEIDPVKALFPRNRHKKKTNVIHFAHGMSMHILGANNKTNLQRRSIRWLIGDETWRWPTGHMAEAEARVTAFGWLGKRIFLSQGGEADDDTDKKFKSGTCEEWTFACPCCDHRQAFEWKNVEWDKSAWNGKTWNYAKVKTSTVLLCANPECRHAFVDSARNRKLLNSRGAYVVTNPDASGEVRSFHWNALCASSWGMLAEIYLRAKESAKRGDIAELKIFYQKRMAVSWSEAYDDFTIEIPPGEFSMGDAWEEEAAISKKGTILPAPFNKDDALMPLRIMTVDVQLDHFWCLARSWSADGASRLRAWKKVDTWEDVEAFQQDNGISGALCFLDARHAPHEVYKRCARNGWTALMGDKRAVFPHFKQGPRGRRIRFWRYYSQRGNVRPGGGTCARFLWSNLNVKDILARLIAGKGAPWQIAGNAGDGYRKQLDSERRVKQTNGSFLWEQIGKRDNHLWDCEAMQVVAALMLKIIGADSVPVTAEEEAAAAAASGAEPTADPVDASAKA